LVSGSFAFLKGISGLDTNEAECRSHGPEKATTSAGSAENRPDPVDPQLSAESFPWRAPLSLFLLLSSPRKGRYAGKILVVNERSDKPIRYVKFVASFQEGNELLPLYVDVGECLFPEGGLYTFEISFSARGGEALKGEHPLTVLSGEE
jgi:hypothetical protein